MFFNPERDPATWEPKARLGAAALHSGWLLTSRAERRRTKAFILVMRNPKVELWKWEWEQYGFQEPTKVVLDLLYLPCEQR